MTDPQPTGKFMNPWEHPDFGQGNSEPDSPPCQSTQLQPERYHGEIKPVKKRIRQSDLQPTAGKFTLRIPFSSLKAATEVSVRLNDRPKSDSLVCNVTQTSTGEIVSVELSGTVENLMKSISVE